MATLVDDDGLFDDARIAARLITPGEIANDRAFDVIGGAAGAILGLLALHEATGDADALDRAVACGHHLLAHRTAGEHGHHAWATNEGKRLCGFAHGAAGIAYALLRLAGRSGEEVFREAAAEAIAFEDALYVADRQNWPDLRPVSPDHPEAEYAATWCNGGAGIGLARLGGLAALDTPQIRADIDHAMDVIRREGGQGVDHLCCGNLGRADVLLEMGSRLGRPDLDHAARVRVANHRRRALERGGYRLWWETGGGISVPGLFQGTSGVGYALLRAAFPDRLPSVLLWA
jgi:lantibiotic modifying enzyme